MENRRGCGGCYSSRRRRWWWTFQRLFSQRYLSVAESESLFVLNVHLGAWAEGAFRFGASFEDLGKESQN